MKKIFAILSVLSTIVLLTFCQPDGSNSENPGNTVGTPYTLNVPKGFPQPNIPPDNPMTVEGVKLGRHLFYEKALSGDNSMSCGGCHSQQRAFTDGTPVSIGIDGIPGRRKAMPLFNLAFHDNFFWDGRSVTLEEQAIIPIEDPIELNADMATVIQRLTDNPLYPPMFEEAFGSPTVTEERIGKAIAQFERTLISANSKFDSVSEFRLNTGATFTPQEQLGFEMFNSEEGDCFHCHGGIESSFLMGAFGRDLQFVNNGLKANYTDQGRAEVTGDPTDVGKFKVPSVRNVEFSFPYMHDGSIPNLDSLIGFYDFGGHKHPNVDPNMKRAGIGRNWTPEQKVALAAFLRTLTDYQFLTDTAFSDPFQD
jgi:cytochrome c peroxidase